MTKRTITTILVSTILAGSLFAAINIKNNPVREKTEVSFIEQDWEKTLKSAKESHKLIFVDLYATWCGPCKMLKRNTFTNKEVAEFFNANFVNASVDVEKGVGISLAEKYNVSMLPTLIVAREDGKPILFTTGYLEPKEILKFARAALEKSKK